MRYKAIALQIIIIIAIIAGSQVLAADLAPGEENTGFFYYLTHLRPGAYVVLFLIFMLSIGNLYYQYITPGGALYYGSPPSSNESAENEDQNELDDYETEYDREILDRMDSLNREADTIVAVRKIFPGEGKESEPDQPTPLDGVDHPLPSFTIKIDGANQGARHMEQEETKEVDEDSGAFKPHFRFASMIDPDSVEPRDQIAREELQVYGFVLERNDEPVPGALVFLIDREGNRIGQSSRSQPGTGEFTALAQEPGKYRLNAHKRGMRLLDKEPIELEKTSGTIEGLVVRMIEEGCKIKGRIVQKFEGDLDSMVRLQVVCKAGPSGFVRSVRPAQDGYYSIIGAPESDSCVLELLDSDGNMITRTEPFETYDGGEVNLEFELIDKDSEEINGNGESD